MKKVILTATSIAALAFGFQASADDLSVQLAAEKNCKTVGQIVTNAVDAQGGAKAAEAAVAGIVETAIKAKASCACEIVTAAIESTGASAKGKKAMIEAIVESAYKASPAESATITECAVAAAPAHAATIEKVLNRVFAEKDEKYLGEGSAKQGYVETESAKQGYGKGGGEVEPGQGTRGPDWDIGAVAFPAPVYLIAPAGGIIPPGESPPSPSPTNAVVDSE